MTEPVQGTTQSAPSARPGRRRAPRRTGRTVLRVLGGVTLVMAMVMGLTSLYYYRSLSGNITSVDIGDQLTNRPTMPEYEGPHGPLNILVMGSDTREGAGNDVGGEVDGTQRSDTTILLHISADRKTVYGISMPRDAMVDRPDCIGDDGDTIPGENPAMFNSAFTVGGPACTVQTVEQLTGVRINNFVVVDFAGFKGMVDALGGVEVCLPHPVVDVKAKVDLPAGTQTLEGTQALGYVRMRHEEASANGDLGRMKRQQAFIASMIKKVASSSTLLRPDKVAGFLKAATKSLTTDEGLGSIPKMAGLALQLRNTDLSDITFVTVPNVAWAPDPNRVEWTSDADALWQRVIADEPLTPEQLREAVTSDQPTGSEGSDDPSGSPSGTPSQSPTDAPSGTPSGSASPSDGATTDPVDRERVAAENGLCA